MRTRLSATVLRLGAFALGCGAATFAVIMIFAQLRFDPETTYSARFTDVSGLAAGQFVRVAGVEVGKVKSIDVTADNTAKVTFSANDSVPLTEDTRAYIRYENLIGDRYVELREGAADAKRLPPGGGIPVQNTQPALDLDALIGGFRPLFRALNPDQVNALSGQLLSILQGQGATINSFLAQTATLTSSLADRDQLIGDLITNLNSVLGSIGDQSDKFGEAVTSLSQLVEGLSAQKTEIADAVGHTSSAAAETADLLSRIRPGFSHTVSQTDRASGIVVADHEYFDNLINTLPDAYRALGRQGIYGDFFTFYMCDLLFKVNGKGGQPVYIQVANQVSGRCTPR